MPAVFPNQYAPDSVFRFVSLSTTGQMASSNGAFLSGGIISNVNAAARYVKLYNKATAATQADTPVMTILVPATTTLVLEPMELPFPLGISVRATTGAADNDTGAPSANDIIVNLLYRG